MKKVPVNGSIEVNKKFIIPDTEGVPGQTLMFPSSGNTLEWKPIKDTDNLTQLSSGSVIWDHNLVFNVTRCDYYILGNLYTSDPATVTLDNGDATYPRLDVIYVDSNAEVGVLKGVPAADPAKPIVDPLTQLELTSILIDVNGTTPANINNDIVYSEGSEWTILPGATLNVNPHSTENVLSGVYCLKVSTKNNSNVIMDSLYFTSTDLSLTKSTFIFNIKFPGTTGNPYIIIQLSDGITNATITLNKNNFSKFGGDFSKTTWQQIVIPAANFSKEMTTVNTIGIHFSGTVKSGASYFLDNVGFQSGLIINTTVVNEIEEIQFQYPDVAYNTAQNYIIRTKAAYAFVIKSLVIESDQDITGLIVRINGIAVTGLSNFTSTSTATERTAAANNTVNVGDKVTLYKPSTITNATTMDGAFRIQRI